MIRHLASLALASLLAFSSVGCAGTDDPEILDDVEEALASAGSETPEALTAFPTIMLHGYGGSDSVMGFNNIARYLTKRGFVVSNPAVPPYNAPLRRAGFFAKAIDEMIKKTGAKKVNIVAHSSGGIDARILVTQLGYGDRIASITTIGTPHRGTLLADYSLKLYSKEHVEPAVKAIARWLGRRVTTEDLANDEDLIAAIEALTESGAPEFNRANPNDERVYYQSWAGVSARVGVGDSEDMVVCERKLSGKTDKMNPLLTGWSLIVGHGLGIQDSFRPNDGLSTVESAKWGNFRGCLRADHVEEMGGLDGKMKENGSGFYAPRFYEEMLVDLAKRGY